LFKKPGNPVKRAGYVARVLCPADFDDKLIAAWVELEARADVPNAFLSPYFVLPALRYLEASANSFGVFVEKTSGGVPTLVGVALFKVRESRRRFPLKHVEAFESIHSYLSGFLLDREYANDALAMIYGYLTEKRHSWHAIYVNNCPPENLLTEEARGVAAGLGIKWHSYDSWQRAIFRPSSDNNGAGRVISKHDLKDYQRNMRHLKEFGSVDWIVSRGMEPLDHVVDDFIRLEHMGWKGTGGTSLYSNENHLHFFKGMIDGFNRAGRAYFTELRLDGRTIASTSNLISGRVGFGFKMGWDIQYAKYSPGILNVTQIVEQGMDAFCDLEFMDSSAAPESYINRIWSGRRDIVEGMFSLTPMGHAVLSSAEAAMQIKTFLFHQQNDPDRAT